MRNLILLGCLMLFSTIGFSNILDKVDITEKTIVSVDIGSDLGSLEVFFPNTVAIVSYSSFDVMERESVTLSKETVYCNPLADARETPRIRDGL